MRRQVGERAATNAPWKSVLRKGLNPQPLCMSDWGMELLFVAANRAWSTFHLVAGAPLNVGSASDISEAPRNDGARLTESGRLRAPLSGCKCSESLELQRRRPGVGFWPVGCNLTQTRAPYKFLQGWREPGNDSARSKVEGVLLETQQRTRRGTAYFHERGCFAGLHNTKD